ncbi:MAG: transglutaminase-like domain-containing protein [Thermodesulfobacteriota bacterium]|jgi:hypothetical protein
MKKFFIAGLILSAVFLNASVPLQAASYEETVAQWTSYKDVAKWLDKYFTFDKTRPMSFVPRSPEETFKLRSGRCYDGAAFAKDALNRINPAYNAKFIFMEFSGLPNHWQTAFTLDGKLFIMDYSAGGQLSPIMGTHGPFDSLRQYQDFLSSKGFKANILEYRKND